MFVRSFVPRSIANVNVMRERESETEGAEGERGVNKFLGDSL